MEFLLAKGQEWMVLLASLWQCHVPFALYACWHPPPLPLGLWLPPLCLLLVLAGCSSPPLLFSPSLLLRTAFCNTAARLCAPRAWYVHFTLFRLSSESCANSWWLPAVASNFSFPTVASNSSVASNFPVASNSVASNCGFPTAWLPPSNCVASSGLPPPPDK